MLNRDENRDCLHVHMSPARKLHVFRFIPLSAAIVVFYRALSSMRYSETESAAKTSICVHIHPSLNSSLSEDSQLGPAGGI